jgi:ATP-binding cassette subfamily C protein
MVLIVDLTVYGFLAIVLSWKATLLSLAASVVILAISHHFVRLARKAGKGQTKWYGSLLRTLTDLLGSVKSLKAMGREQQAEALLRHETNALRRELKREVLGNAALDGAQESLTTAVLAIGIYVAIAQLSMELATVTFLVLILARLLRQAGKVQKQYQKMIGCESAYWALQEVIDAAQAAVEPVGGTATPVLERSIRLDDVSLAYGDEPVLQHASLEIPAGLLTCLVGESGTGKSTIADLIIGLIRPQAGRVLVDDRPLDEFNLREWRRGIGYVPQDNVLLHDTVLRNVALAEDALGEAEVTEALELAGAMEFVRTMPEGIHSMVGEAGARLSGGQRQRILIARALVHRPRLLILDEATSALDAATEQALCQTLASLKGRVTILAISHQRALRELADRVYLVERGRIGLAPSETTLADAHAPPAAAI